jgi:hypothetical protein
MQGSLHHLGSQRPESNSCFLGWVAGVDEDGTVHNPLGPKTTTQILLYHEEDDVTRSIISMIAASLFLTGCGSQGNVASNAPAAHGSKSAPYRLAFGGGPAKPNASGLTIPPIEFAANPDVAASPDLMESRANLVVQFDASGLQRQGTVVDQTIVGPADISGRYGMFSAYYVDTASRELAQKLSDYCINGTVKISVAITKSSILPSASPDQVNAKRLSDWLPTEVEFKNPNTKCEATTKRPVEEQRASIGG